MNFQASQFQFQPEGKVYVAEASDLGLLVGVLPREIVLDGSLFVFSHTDRDASGEDVAGWNYRVSMGGVFWNKEMANARILIIND